MSYRELVIDAARDTAEALSDTLMDLGALSVSIEDADADTPDEQPVFGEPGMVVQSHSWHHSRVVALLSADQDPDVLLRAAANHLLLPVPSFETREIADQDWVRLTQSQFAPIAIGRHIWVVPSWHDAPDPDALILELDPGLAFGTGSHPTTRLCMEWLESQVQNGDTVLDYGCGSGILAILAVKCGARDVVGIDIDAQAVATAHDNAARNRVAGQALRFGLPDALPAAASAPGSATGAQAVAEPGATFDIVVANILSNPLKVLASMLCGRVRPGGRIALSGVLARQAEEVAAAYAPWIDMHVWREHEGWVCLSGTRRA
ncbi:ribosomal protein L11 methyltransferase [Robbsia andropogonis]|uniref:Ribosomal protein L11 methyltransferase n=1 Tax=Robbsia andropogonis TaxID=28092 RepID=A0A0F5JZJ2_9BURK|nr:50S ribosomal protein L11 methyltransferase [Robbsia andropogonis]KKB63024.1 ribosomal protein L11 methyltransferase [Robbsia andropogonis]MCP1118318.1 50S ribosomal protein L11 methyltransferase [Robbsia andropogonis]MCP1127904.1 50S ribosomal protein L11 methyltransferase [Robbsia andropogonis]